MKNIHTHYDNLKVSRSAPTEVIRAAYRVLAQKYHPDRNPGDSRAVRIMKTINASYEVLSDPVKRQEYDQWVTQQELMLAQEAFASRQPQRTPPPPSGPAEEAAGHGAKYFAILREKPRYKYLYTKIICPSQRTERPTIQYQAG